MARNPGHLSPRSSTRLILQNSRKTNMAAERRAGTQVDYLQLNSLSSVVFFDTARKKYKKGETIRYGGERNNISDFQL